MKNNSEFKVVSYGSSGRTHKIYYFKCPKCGKESWVDERTYHRKQNGELCGSCLRSVICKRMIDKRLSNMSESDKKEYIEKLQKSHKAYIDNMSDIDKERLSKIRSINTSRQMLKQWQDANYRNKRSEKVSNQMNDFWNSDNTEKQSDIISKLHNGRDKYFNNDDISLRNEKISNALKGNTSFQQWWNNLAEDEREQHRIRIKNTFKQYYDNLSPDEKSIQLSKLSDAEKRYWKSLSEEEKSQKIYNALIASKGKNSLHKRFETMFYESHLTNDYYIQSECICINKTIHSWDYGIYEKNTNKLVMVVDLDGAYFHADECDYDGIHSREEYDEKRSLSIPDETKSFIIQEFKFKQCFENMIKMLMIDYDEYVNNIFNMMRKIPFPYPKYDNKELIHSYIKLTKMKCDDKYHNDISLNTRLGDRLIQHFHESIWHAHTRGNKSPYDAWYNDKLLKQCIQNRIIYQTYLNPNKILQGFNVSKIAQKVSVFSAGRAKLIISKYLSNYDTIFDPFSGFSGRMLGTISLNKQYIGQDISSIHVRESNKIIKFLLKSGFDINVSIIESNVLQSYGEYPCLFTCPPYSDKEQWEDVIVDNRSCDDWIDICLNHFKCNRYVFVVDNTIKYKDYIVDEINNKSHLNSNKEFLVLIERGIST